MNRITLGLLREQYAQKKKTMNEELDQQKHSVEFIQTKVVNTGSGYVQVSGGTPNITINIGDGKPKKEEEPVEEAVVVDEQKELIDRLKKVCYGDVVVASTFLEQIKGMKSTEITKLVHEYIEAKKISEYSSHRDLWSILHEYGYYKPSESNWNQRLNESI